MRTTKPFSTISYNTDSFLKLKLDDLTRRHVIEFYCFIKHEPEEDEKKAHIHLYVEPSSHIDTVQFVNEFSEVDLKNPLKPLGCLRCQSSKFADWYLYAIHDSAYLSSKGQSRKYHYNDDDLVKSDDDVFLDLKHHIDWSKINTLGKVLQAAQDGQTFEEFIIQNPVPLLSVRSVQFVFERVQNQLHTTDRNGSSTHTPKIDPETGEILD